MEKHVHGIILFKYLFFESIYYLIFNFNVRENHQVFTTAAYDDHKNIVLLAFEMIEKIVRDYFQYITETETTTFTDCVNCLIAFTSSRFDIDISLSAIAFLRLCAAKLAKGDLGSSLMYKDKEVSEKTSVSSHHERKDRRYDNGDLEDKEGHLYFWFPLLAGKGKYLAPFFRL